MRDAELDAIKGLIRNFDKLTVPVSAFITFVSEDSKIFALEY